MCVHTACKMIVDEVQYAIKKEDPKKMIEVRTVCIWCIECVCVRVCVRACVRVFMYVVCVFVCVCLWKPDNGNRATSQKVFLYQLVSTRVEVAQCVHWVDVSVLPMQQLKTLLCFCVSVFVCVRVRVWVRTRVCVRVCVCTCVRSV